ncbi:MAG: hypothetical protein ACI8W8_005035 [Rhodothermales bacterium]|jgi:hypothetical protein
MPATRLLACLLILVQLCGCGGDEQETAALNMPAPTPIEEQPGEPPPLEAPKQRLSMNAIKVGDIVLQGVQIGALEPGGEAEFELRLFNTTEWPGTPEAWVGDEKAASINSRRGEEMAGNAYRFVLPLPSPIASSSRLWVRLPTPEGKAETGAFKLQR